MQRLDTALHLRRDQMKLEREKAPRPMPYGPSGYGGFAMFMAMATGMGSEMDMYRREPIPRPIKLKHVRVAKMMQPQDIVTVQQSVVERRPSRIKQRRKEINS